MSAWGTGSAALPSFVPLFFVEAPDEFITLSGVEGTCGNNAAPFRVTDQAAAPSNVAIPDCSRNPFNKDEKRGRCPAETEETEASVLRANRVGLAGDAISMPTTFTCQRNARVWPTCPLMASRSWSTRHRR